MSDEPLIETREAAAAVGMTPKRLRYLVEQYPDRFHVYRVGRKLRFKRSEVVAAFRTEPLNYRELGRLDAHAAAGVRPQ